MEAFIRTFHNGNYDIQFEAALSFDRSENGTLPDRFTQASYNKPDNWRERNRIGLERVKAQLQTCIDSVSHDTSFNVELEHNRYLDQDEEPIVWHEPILDRYWDRLEKKVDGLLATDIQSIYISNVEMKKEVLAALVAMILSGRATNSSTDVVFNNANVCGEGIVWLSKLVDVSSEMTTLYLLNNRIDTMESARCLSRSLKSHACIIYLHLNYCDLGSSPEILSVILQSEVKYINLEQNNIDSLGVVKVAQYLEGDPPVDGISLQHNRLNDDDALLISQALKRNTNLTHLNLVGNNCTSIGVNAILSCVFDSSSLNSISESNHTLASLNIINSQESGDLHGCIESMLLMDRAQKIMLALQDKDSLLKYLANVPVGLIPEVLAFPLRQVDNQRQHEHLNILYSTMRWWNMPLLYSYYCGVKSNTKTKRNY